MCYNIKRGFKRELGKFVDVFIRIYVTCKAKNLTENGLKYTRDMKTTSTWERLQIILNEGKEEKCLA